MATNSKKQHTELTPDNFMSESMEQGMAQEKQRLQKQSLQNVSDDENLGQKHNLSGSLLTPK